MSSKGEMKMIAGESLIESEEEYSLDGRFSSIEEQQKTPENDQDYQDQQHYQPQPPILSNQFQAQASYLQNNNQSQCNKPVDSLINQSSQAAEQGPLIKANQRYKPPKWKKINKESLESQIQKTLVQVGDVTSVYKIKVQRLGSILRLGQKRDILFKKYNWHRYQIDFLSRFFKSEKEFDQWLQNYEADNKLFLQSIMKPQMKHNIYQEQVRGKNFEENKNQNEQLGTNQKRQDKLFFKQMKEEFREMEGDDQKDKYYKQKMKKMHQKHMKVLVKVSIERKKACDERDYWKGVAEDLKRKIKEGMKAHLESACNEASLREQLDSVLEQLKKQQTKEPLIYHDKTKQRHSTLMEQIQPGRFVNHQPSTQFQIDQFHWGRRRWNNKQAQYEGDITCLEMWNQLIMDMIIMNGGVRFLAIVVDPPWKKTGLQLTYNTMPNLPFFSKIPWNQLQDDGYLFLWVTNAQLEEALLYIDKIGYQRCDILVWIKMKKDKTLKNGIGYYLRHVAEFCLIARKANSFQNLKQQTVLYYHTNIIIEEAGIPSQKPTEFYRLVENFIPDYKFLDICGRVCGQRDRWVTTGIQSIDITRQQPMRLHQHNMFHLELPLMTMQRVT